MRYPPRPPLPRPRGLKALRGGSGIGLAMSLSMSIASYSPVSPSPASRKSTNDNVSRELIALEGTNSRMHARLTSLLDMLGKLRKEDRSCWRRAVRVCSFFCRALGRARACRFGLRRSYWLGPFRRRWCSSPVVSILLHIFVFIVL